MKLTKDSKERLSELLLERFEGKDRALWDAFLISSGIEVVKKEAGYGPWRESTPAPLLKGRSCICGIGGCNGGCGKSVNSKKHTIIRDPIFSTDSSSSSETNSHTIGIPSKRWWIRGLKIPKDVAEKFLVLGIP